METENHAERTRYERREKEKREKREERARREKDEKYVRWQGIALTQLGYSINLILVLAPAVLGFGITWLDDECEFQVCPVFLEGLHFSALILLSGSIIFGVFSTVTRLCDFRITRRIANMERKGTGASSGIKKLRDETKCLGKCTWFLFWCQLVTFAGGVIFLAIFITYIMFLLNK